MRVDESTVDPPSLSPTLSPTLKPRRSKEASATEDRFSGRGGPQTVVLFFVTWFCTVFTPLTILSSAVDCGLPTVDMFAQSNVERQEPRFILLHCQECISISTERRLADVACKVFCRDNELDFFFRHRNGKAQRPLMLSQILRRRNAAG